jgi:hypothetical protein
MVRFTKGATEVADFVFWALRAIFHWLKNETFLKEISCEITWNNTKKNRLQKLHKRFYFQAFSYIFSIMA